MAIVVDLPLVPRRQWENVERGYCKRRRPDGTLCGRPVLDQGECYRHYFWYERLPSDCFMPYPEDAVSIQEILAQAMAHVIRGRLTSEQARTIVLLVREMRQNLWAFEREDGWG